ncbi:unnamed protein product [Thlaspi arvense]|uniref:Uncharacterized protein n=1 Tax=Thlaspi arvense TaxID=13288 RepID=A0AAU9STT5_THLAR|nr:unnamed protein product [Thlaspi arvense]
MVEHANNTISIFLEKVAKQEKEIKHRHVMKKTEISQDTSDEEVLIPEFLMAEPTIEEEDMQSDGGNVSEDRREPGRHQPPLDWNPRNHTESHQGFSFDNTSPFKWEDKIYEMHA